MKRLFGTPVFFFTFAVWLTLCYLLRVIKGPEGLGGSGLDGPDFGPHPTSPGVTPQHPKHHQKRQSSLWGLGGKHGRLISVSILKSSLWELGGKRGRLISVKYFEILVVGTRRKTWSFDFC